MVQAGLAPSSELQDHLHLPAGLHSSSGLRLDPVVKTEHVVLQRAQESIRVYTAYRSEKNKTPWGQS